MPEPGIRKKFDLTMPSETHRRIKLFSSNMNVSFPLQNEY